MDNLISNNILFRVTHSINTGSIAVVFTPEKIWELTDSIARIFTYDEIKDVLDELQLFELEPSFFEHEGLLEMEELEEKLREKGFKENCFFNAYVDITYSFDNFPLDISNII